MMAAFHAELAAGLLRSSPKGSLDDNLGFEFGFELGADGSLHQGGGRHKYRDQGGNKTIHEPLSADGIALVHQEKGKSPVQRDRAMAMQDKKRKAKESKEGDGKSGEAKEATEARGDDDDGFVAILDAKVNADESSFKQIKLNIETNSVRPVEVFCRAWPLDRAPGEIPKMTASFLSCTHCYTGTAWGCTSEACDVKINGLEGNRDYKVWCVPQTQPELEDWWPRDKDIYPQDEMGIPWRTERVDPVAVHKLMGIENFLGAALMVLYIWWSFASVRSDNRVIHESAVVVIIGLVIGAILRFVLDRDLDFSYDVFSYHLLPMVIFAAGFQLKSNDMLKRAWHIGLLGLLGTAMAFFVLYTVFGFLTNWSNRERLIAASALCATDTISAIAFVPQTSLPGAHSVILGEGILNDIMAVLISTMVGANVHEQNTNTIIMKFTYFSVASLLCGVLFGACIVQLHRQCMIFQKDTIRAVTLIILLNYGCYTFAESFELSSILALFVCSIISGRYAWHDLPRETQRVSNDVTEMVGMAADSIVYCYFGLTSWTYVDNMESILDMARPVILLTLCMIMLRLVTVFSINGAIGFVGSAFGQKGHALDFSETCMTSLGGMMRGSIAYALILRNVPPMGLRTMADIDIVSMTNKLVIFNTVVYAVVVPFAARKCINKEK